jgi:hypothetical protein
MLSKNSFGNFVIQKILSVGTKKHIKEIFEALTGNFQDLTCDNFGCRVV